MARYTPPTELHPIGVRALALYEAGNASLSDADCRLLESELAKLFGDFTATYDAVHALGALMLFAQQQGKKDAADKVTAIIRSAKPFFAAHNQRVKEDIGDEALAATRRLGQLTGGSAAPRKAPVVGAQRPAGTVSLASLARPMRPLGAPIPAPPRSAR